MIRVCNEKSFWKTIECFNLACASGAQDEDDDISSPHDNIYHEKAFYEKNQLHAENLSAQQLPRHLHSTFSPAVFSALTTASSWAASALEEKGAERSMTTPKPALKSWLCATSMTIEQLKPSKSSQRRSVTRIFV